MAQQIKRRSENVPGDFFVDESCIDCDTCRWMAPGVFARVNGQSAVRHQPPADDRERSLQALLSCPTASIGTVNPPAEIKKIQEMFPLAIADGVYHCGYHSPQSFGAASYFIQHPQGNILVDSPRFAKPLVRQLEALGGVRYLYLTHRDDVADHQIFHDHFGCDRLLHARDITEDTQSVEIQITGDAIFDLFDDVAIIPVPGHTAGHTVLHYRDEFLFSGDHIAWSDDRETLIAFKNYCFYSWDELKVSVAKLKDYNFEWVLPGHGRRCYADSVVMQAHLQNCLDWLASN